MPRQSSIVRHASPILAIALMSVSCSSAGPTDSDPGRAVVCDVPSHPLFGVDGRPLCALSLYHCTLAGTSQAVTLLAEAGCASAGCVLTCMDQNKVFGSELKVTMISEEMAGRFCHSTTALADFNAACGWDVRLRAPDRGPSH
jgi:hypothetical protein